MTSRTLGWIVVLALSAGAWGGQETPPPAPAPAAGDPPAEAAVAEEDAKPLDPVQVLLDQVKELQQQVRELRQELAEARLEASTATSELAELRQFVADHHQFGDDFEQYKAVKEIKEREQRRLELEARREARDAHRAQRDAEKEAARAEYQKRRAEANRNTEYRKRGFTPLGLEVYVSRMSYHYSTQDATRSRIDYEPGIGNYLRLYPNTVVDYSSMTISGSVLNASGELRNMGVAITFFDEDGNQVGHETVQVNNARPDVPYPFTSTISMALNRPFASSSTYVLYSDPIAPPEEDQ